MEKVTNWLNNILHDLFKIKIGFRVTNPDAPGWSFESDKFNWEYRYFKTSGFKINYIIRSD